MPIFTVDPVRDEDIYWLDPTAMPGEGALPGHNDCTPEKRGAGGKDAQEGRAPASPSPIQFLSSGLSRDNWFYRRFVEGK